MATDCWEDAGIERCPFCYDRSFCSISVHDLPEDEDGDWYIRSQHCDSCGRVSIFLGRYVLESEETTSETAERRYTSEDVLRVRPLGADRRPAPPEVPSDLAEDYNEAITVLNVSPKASAALSRRCLQALLIQCAGVDEKQPLAHQIEAVLSSRQLPSYIAKDLDVVRQIGNFAAHPIKSQKTGEITQVEPGEAEWTLNVLESLFDFYFVQPTIAEEKRDRLNQKLADTKKPPRQQSQC